MRRKPLLWGLAAAASSLLLLALLFACSESIEVYVKELLDEAIRDNVVWSSSSPPQTAGEPKMDA